MTRTPFRIWIMLCAAFLNRVRAMPDGPRSHPSGQALLRVLAADAVSIAIAVFCVLYFGGQLVRGGL
jgi:hypothetical protein